MEKWHEGDRLGAICPKCERLVEAFLTRRSIQLAAPIVDVFDVLVWVCRECDKVVAVPNSSSSKIREARSVAKTD